MPLIELQSDAVAEVYAQSLFALAKAAGGRDAAQADYQELKAVVDLGRADRQFGEFLSSRIVPVKDKAATLTRIFRGQVSDRVLNFLLVVNRKGRLARVTSILRALDELLQEEFGRVELDVTTAMAMSADASEALRQRLSQVVHREVSIHAKVDPALLGGIRVQIGDQLIDASVQTQLRRVRDQFESSGLPAIRAIAGKLS